MKLLNFIPEDYPPQSWIISSEIDLIMRQMVNPIVVAVMVAVMGEIKRRLDP